MATLHMHMYMLLSGTLAKSVDFVPVLHVFSPEIKSQLKTD